MAPFSSGASTASVDGMIGEKKEEDEEEFPVMKEEKRAKNEEEERKGISDKRTDNSKTVTEEPVGAARAADVKMCNVIMDTECDEEEDGDRTRLHIT